MYGTPIPNAISYFVSPKHLVAYSYELEFI